MVPPDDPDSAQAFDITLNSPQDITKGPGGKLWTASDDQLVSFKPSNPLGFKSTTIDGMVGARGIDALGNTLWIADFGGGRIFSSTPSGNAQKYKVGGGPQQVAAGPDDTIAYGNPGTDPQTVGRITEGGNPKKTKDPLSDPFGMAFAHDKNWWIAEFAKSQLGMLSEKGDLKQFKDLPDNSGPRYLTLGPNGTIWVSLEQSQKVARIKGVS